jgi:hypothetical protein
MIIEEFSNSDIDGFPTSNCPAYVDAMEKCNCTNEHILRCDAGRFYDLIIKQSSFLENEKGLFAGCDIKKGINLLILIDEIISYYWGRFMTKNQVKTYFDDKGRESHRLMKCDINEKYKYINGDMRCAGTYINDPKGSGSDPNVIYENNLGSNEMEFYIPIRTLRNITAGEEFLVDYGNLFFNINDESTEINNNKIQVNLIILCFRKIT